MAETRDDRETCITHIDSDNRVGVYTSERKYINKINKLKEQYPDEVIINRVNPDGSICADFPASWMVFPKPKAKRTYSDEQKQAMAERMKKARKSK